MRHQHKVSGVEPLVMNGMVVNVAKNGLGSKPVRGVMGVNKLAKLVHHVKARLILGRNLTLTH
jgi:hypothetical protein